MKLSADTIQILKNFASINSNMLIRKGSTLSTISAAKSIFAKAQIPETFPHEFAIYDLNSLLQLLTFADDQEVNLGEKSLEIVNDVGTFEYFYCDTSLIKNKPPEKDIEVDSVFDFSLTMKDIQSITKTAGVLSAPTISLTARKGLVTMRIGDKKNDSANSFNKAIGESATDFECNIAAENFKLMPDTYDVVLSRKLFCQFKSKSRDLSYLIAMEPGSTV